MNHHAPVSIALPLKMLLVLIGLLVSGMRAEEISEWPFDDARGTLGEPLTFTCPLDQRRPVSPRDLRMGKLPDGSLYILYRSGEKLRVLFPRGGPLERTLPDLPSGVFMVHPVDEWAEEWLAVQGDPGEGRFASILRLTIQGWKPELTLHGFEKLAVDVSRDGSLWLHGIDGLIGRYSGGEIQTHRFAEAAPLIPPDQLQRTHRPPVYYHRLEMFESPEGAVGFHEQFVSQNKGSSAGKIVIWRDGKWMHLPIAVRPAGAFFLSETRIMVLSEAGLTEYDLTRGEAVATIPPPAGFDEDVRPTFLRRLADGGLVTLWSAGIHAVNGRDTASKIRTMEGGVFSRLVEFRDGAWHPVSILVDAVNWQAYSPLRPSVVDEHGGLWIGTADGAILHREALGRWRRVDWRNGLVMRKASQIYFDKHHVWYWNEDIWTPEEQGWYRASKEMLMEQPPRETAWREIAFRSPLRLTPKKRAMALSLEPGTHLVTMAEGGLETVARIPHDQFYGDISPGFLLDSNEGVWLLNSDDKQFAHIRDGTWKVFDSLEPVFQTYALPGKAFQIGEAQDYLKVVYSGDGRAAYLKNDRHTSSVLRYFDGEVWRSTSSVRLRQGGDWRYRDHPFFHAGNLAIHVGDKTYQMENSEPDSVTENKGPKSLALLPKSLAHPDPSPEGIEPPPFPKDNPLPAGSEPRKRLYKDGWHWGLGERELVASPGGEWIRIPIEKTPFAGGFPLMDQFRDYLGNWFFQVSGTPTYRYFVHPAVVIPLKAKREDAGVLQDPLDALRPEWSSSWPRDRLWVQVDAGEKNPQPLLPPGEIHPGILPQGVHTLRLKVYERDGLGQSRPISFTFRVTYDLPQWLDRMIGQLGHENIEEREMASEKLARIGIPAHEALRRNQNHEDPEIRHRIEQILQNSKNKLEGDAAGTPP